MIQDPDDILQLARYPADDGLFPTPNQVAAAAVPHSHLDRLADTAVLVNVGSRSLLELQDGQRLFREVGLLLVVGSRPAIRTSSIKRLLGPPA